jgi:heme/copper-type cytochrome/quinol oxidase subunit 3
MQDVVLFALGVLGTFMVCKWYSSKHNHYSKLVIEVEPFIENFWSTVQFCHGEHLLNVVSIIHSCLESASDGITAESAKEMLFGN